VDANEIKEFECPVCSLKRWLIEVLGLKDAPPKTTDRLFGDIAKELKTRGIMPKDKDLYKEVNQDVPIPDHVKARIPIGSEMPAFAFVADICTECGTQYAVKVQRLTATQGRKPPKIDIARLHLPGMSEPRSN
jgi:hypothetical protein